MAVRGKVKNGKVILDDPKALPEGAEFIGHVLELGAPVNGLEFDARGEYLLVSSYEAAEVYAFARQ